MDKDVATWTVNRIEDYQRVKDLGCKYVTTDYLVINQ
jgi:glycerophosphoryl diester phosphodiesterase